MRLNLPNGITLMRLCMLPLVLVPLWPDRVTPRGAFVAAMAYICAGIFDVVDGVVARRTGQVTPLGKFLDPLADKLFYLVTLLALLQLSGDWVPTWVVMVVLVRELAITGLRGIAAVDGIVIAASSGGKVKTSLSTAGIVSLMLHYPYILSVGFTEMVVDARTVGLALTYLSLVYSLASAYAYVRDFLRAQRALHAPVGNAR